MTDHRELQQLMGGYVLGGLSAADRQAFEAHLESCTSCRDEVLRHASLPGLLRPGPLPSGPSVPAPAPGPDPEMLPRLLAAVSGERAVRRRRTAAAGVVAAAAVVAALFFAIDSDEVTPEEAEPARVVALDAAGASNATGEGLLIEKGWGTEVRLSAAALPGDGPFRLVVVAPDGARQLAATWGATPGGQARVTGATSFTPGDIAEVRVLGPDGAVLVGSGTDDRDD